MTSPHEQLQQHAKQITEQAIDALTRMGLQRTDAVTLLLVQCAIRMRDAEAICEALSFMFNGYDPTNKAGGGDVKSLQ